MKKLNYELQISEHEMHFVVSYRENPPKFVMDVITKASQSNMNVSNWLKNAKNLLDTEGLFNVVAGTFENYRTLFIGADATASAEMKKIINNGYLERKENVNATFSTLSPLVESYKITIDGKSFPVSSREDAANVVMKIIAAQRPNGYEFAVSESYFSEEPDVITQKIELVLQNGQITLYGQKINYDALDIKDIYSQNDLASFTYETKRLFDESIDSEWEFLGADEYNFDDWTRCSLNGFLSYFALRNASVEILKIALYHGIIIFKKETLMSYDFGKDHETYEMFLEMFIKGGFQPNKFMFLAFLKNEQELLPQLLKEKSNLQKLVNDKEVLTKLLILNKDFTLEKLSLNKSLVEEIISNASIPQLDIILKKLSEEFRDTLTSTKVLTKLKEISFDLLSTKQLEIVKNEEERKRLEREEFEICIGKITISGLREGIKSMSKQKKIELGIADKNNSVKKFLDKHIGHASVNLEITPHIISEAKRISKIAEKYKKTIKN